MPLSTQEWGDVRNEFAEWIEENPEFQDDSPNSLFEVKNKEGERVFHVAFEYADDSSAVEYVFNLNFEKAGEGGAGSCESIEEAVSVVNHNIRSFQQRSDVPRIGPGHVDLDDRTEEVEVQKIVASTNLSDFFD